MSLLCRQQSKAAPHNSFGRFEKIELERAMKKQPIAPVFSDELAKPIIIDWPPPGLGELGGDPEKWEANASPKHLSLALQTSFERLKKMDALRAHYGILERSESAYFFLAYQMACDLVPGFQVLLDSPAARTMKLPNAFHGNTKPIGMGQIPEHLSGQKLILLFKLANDAWPHRSEKAIAEEIIKHYIPEMQRPGVKGDMLKMAKTLRNRLAIARKN